MKSRVPIREARQVNDKQFTVSACFPKRSAPQIQQRPARYGARGKEVFKFPALQVEVTSDLIRNRTFKILNFNTILDTA